MKIETFTFVFQNCFVSTTLRKKLFIKNQYLYPQIKCINRKRLRAKIIFFITMLIMNVIITLTLLTHIMVFKVCCKVNNF